MPISFTSLSYFQEYNIYKILHDIFGEPYAYFKII